jgi:hypothetical protein
VKSLDLEIYNISLINCNKVFADSISDNIVSDLHQFELLHSKITHSDTKKLLFHHIIYELCEAILKSDKNTKKILFFNYTQLIDCSILKFFDEVDIINVIKTVLERMKRVLPVRIYMSKYSLIYFDHLLTKRDGRGSMLLNDIIKRFETEYKTFTFSDIKKFTKKYDLTFLNTDYFNRLSTKLLLIK